MIQNLKKKFLNREQIRGAMIFDFFSPGIPYVIKNSGCEFVIYDMEHGGLTLDKFKELSLISKGIGLNPMIRIPEISYNYIARSLDLGANGIMIPMVNHQKEALEIIKPYIQDNHSQKINSSKSEEIKNVSSQSDIKEKENLDDIEKKIIQIFY